MKFHAVLLSVILSLSFVGNVQSQDRDLANIGSFYSSFGIGAPADVYSPGTMGMGLTGVSNYSSYTPNISNPAHWGLTSYTQGNVSLALTNYYASDNTFSARNSLLGVESFQITVPVDRNRFGLSMSFSPVSRSDYQKFGGGEFTPAPGLSLSSVEYETNTSGHGGVNRFELGTGYRPFSFLSIGYGFSANLLSLQQEVLTAFPSNSPYNSTVFDRAIEGYGFGHRFGIFTNFSGIFSSSDQISIGATVNLPVSIDADESVTLFQQVEGQSVRVELNENAPDRKGSIQLPMEFNAGLTYNLNRFSNFTAEFQLQNWSDSDFSYSQTQQSYYKDRLRAGMGLQFHPYRAEQPGGFFSNFKYSVGTTYDTGHLSIQNQNIETLFLNAGIGLFSPRSTSQSSVDLSFHYGIRGTHSTNLVKENIWGFKLSLNLAEFMFIQTRFQ
ncbi:MAG: hypothetical protein WEA56_05535 [Balneolaceae bacterium]